MVTKDDLQLCESITETEAKQLPDSDYTANRKYDGERVVAVVKGGQVALLNRRGFSPIFQFEEVVTDLKAMPDCVLDGEVIDHTDTFSKLQRRAGTRDRAKQQELKKIIPVKYKVFDILSLEDKPLVRLPLRQRVEKLTEVFKEFNKKFPIEKPCVEMAEYEPVKVMLEKAHKEDREGILVKNWNGIYEGRRSKNWQKCKFWIETSIKVCKYEVNPKGIRAEDIDGNAVQCSGQQSIALKEKIDTYGEAEIQVQYLEKTADGRMRFPSYRGLVGE